MRPATTPLTRKGERLSQIARIWTRFVNQNGTKIVHQKLAAIESLPVVNGKVAGLLVLGGATQSLKKSVAKLSNTGGGQEDVLIYGLNY